jgi:hypothetical protein
VADTEPHKVAWIVCQVGWEVVDQSGSSLGQLTEVLGDQERDIFDGIRYRAADGSVTEVHAEQISEIDEGRLVVSE